MTRQEAENTARHKIHVVCLHAVEVALRGHGEAALLKETNDLIAWLGLASEPTPQQCEAAAEAFSKAIHVRLEDARIGAGPALKAAFNCGGNRP